jgi:hypothetical protein
MADEEGGDWVDGRWNGWVVKIVGGDLRVAR